MLDIHARLQKIYCYWIHVENTIIDSKYRSQRNSFLNHIYILQFDLMIIVEFHFGKFYCSLKYNVVTLDIRCIVHLGREVLSVHNCTIQEQYLWTHGQCWKELHKIHIIVICWYSSLWRKRKAYINTLGGYVQLYIN